MSMLFLAHLANVQTNFLEQNSLGSLLTLQQLSAKQRTADIIKLANLKLVDIKTFAPRKDGF